MIHTIYHLVSWLWGGNGQGGANSTGYLITSGPLPDITLLGGAGLILRRHNCHIRGCWRLAWHPHPDHGHPLCRRHHPHTVTKEGINGR